MQHRIVIEFDSGTGNMEVDTGSTESSQAATILLSGAKKLRQQEGVLQCTVTKDVKTQGVSVDFQSDEIKDWGELLGMLDQAKRQSEFQQWYGMFMAAQGKMAAQAQAEMHRLQMAAGAGKRLHLPGG